MAEVGVLNLTIKDNSEKAGEGLSKLAGALTAVKTAVQNFDLSPIGQKLNDLNDQISKVRGTKELVKNLGAMFNALTKFSQIKGFNLGVDEMREYAKTLTGTADALERVNKAKEASMGDKNFFDGMVGGAEKAAKTVEETVETFDVQYARLKEVTGGWANALRTQIFSSGPSRRQSPGQIEMDIPGLAKTESIVESTESLARFNEQIKETNESSATSGLKTIIVSFNDIGKTISSTTSELIKFDSLYSKMNKEYNSQYGGAVPDNMMLSTRVNTSEQYKPNWTYYDPEVAEQAKAKQEEIAENQKRVNEDVIRSTNELIANLEKPIDYSNFQEYADVVAGFFGGSGNYSNIGPNSQLFKDLSALQVFNIPAMDKDGPFEYASDEIVRYSGLLRKAQDDIEFWGQKYEEVQNRIKYNGATEERLNEAAQYEKSFYLAVATAEEYENHLKQINDYIDTYQQKISNADTLKNIFEIPELRQLLEGLQGAEAQMAAIQAISSGTGISVEEIQTRLAELSGSADQFGEAMGRVADAEGRVNDATGTANSGVGQFNDRIGEITNAADPAISKIELLQNRIQHLWGRIGLLNTMPRMDEFGNDTGVTNAINNYLLQIGRTYEQLQRLIDKSHEAQDAMQFDRLKTSAMEAIDQQVKWTDQDIGNLVNNYSQIDLLEMKMAGMQQALLDDINQNKVDTQQIAERTIAIQNLKDKIEELKNAQDETTESTRSFGFSFKDFKRNLKSAFPLISQLGSRLKSIIIRRTLTAALRKIVSGAKEGLKNVYEYSKAVGTSFAPAMDSAASSLATMKNALGAALAPAVQALIPVLQNLVNWFINLLNQVNQFFSLLNGQRTWTRAVPQTVSAFDKQEKAAKKTGAAIKDLLADWDELNIIQSNTSGAGSGAGTSVAEDYLKMFEEVSVFDNKIKDTVNWVKDNIKLIEGVATAIGAAILGWKLSNALLSGVGDLRSLALEGIGIAVGLQLTWSGAYDAGLNGGFDTATLLSTASGILMTTISSALIGWKFGGPWGAVIGAGAGLIVSLAVALSAYYDGERTKKLRDKWGKLTLTQEQIDELVDSEVTATVKAEIDIVDASVDTRMNARIKANGAILKFSQSLQSAKFALEAGSDPASINTALTSAQEAIKAIQTELESSKEGLALSFTSFKYTDKEGNDVTKKLYSSLSKGENALDTFFSDLGKDIAKLISKGFDEGLSDEEQLMALNLMETLQRVTTQAERNYEINKLVRDSQHEMENVYSLETAEGVFNTQQDRLEQYKQTRYNQIKEDLEDRNRELEYYKAIQDVYKERGDTAKVDEYAGYIQDSMTAIDNLNQMIDEMENGTYKWDLDEMYSTMFKNMQQGWIDKFKEWFRQGVIDSLINGNENPFDNNSVAAKIMGGYGFSTSQLMTDENIEEIVKAVKELYPVEGNDAMNQMLTLGHILKIMPDLGAYLNKSSEFGKIQSIDYEKIAESFVKFNITPDNYNNLINKFWEYIFTEPAEKIKDAIDEKVQEWTPPANSGSINASRFIGRNGTYSDTGFTNKYDMNPSDPYANTGLVQIMQQFADRTSKEAEEADMAKAVETGTTNANKNQNEILNSIQSGIEKLLKKNWTVSVFPSSSWGNHNQKSGERWNKVNGG